MTSGIYQIRNAITGKSYVGKAINLERRKYQHFSNLRNSRHHNIKLQRSFQKHGETNFVFEVIEECAEEILAQREQYYIDLHGTEKLYNIVLITDDSQRSGCYHAARQKIDRIFRKPEHYMRAVCQINKNDVVINIYETIYEAAHETRINHLNIGRCCRKLQYAAGGYGWQYESDYVEQGRGSTESTKDLLPYNNYPYSMSGVFANVLDNEISQMLPY